MIPSPAISHPPAVAPVGLPDAVLADLPAVEKTTGHEPCGEQGGVRLVTLTARRGGEELAGDGGGAAARRGFR